MAWVGARAFDTVGVTSFQALAGAAARSTATTSRPRSSRRGSPSRCWRASTSWISSGSACCRARCARCSACRKPFVGPGGLRRASRRPSGLRGRRRRRSTRSARLPKPVPAEAPLDGLDAYEQQLASIAGNSYDADAKYVTSNVNLWPRPLVIVMGNEAFDVADGRAAVRPARGRRGGDPEGARGVARGGRGGSCRSSAARGLTFAAASESDLAELRAALEPVYADLGSDPETKSYIDAITEPQGGDRGFGGSARLRRSDAGGSASAGHSGGHVRDDDHADGLGRAGAGRRHHRRVHAWSSTDGEVTIRPPERRGRVPRRPTPSSATRSRPWATRTPSPHGGRSTERGSVHGLRSLRRAPVRPARRVQLPRCLGVASLGTRRAEAEPDRRRLRVHRRRSRDFKAAARPRSWSRTTARIAGFSTAATSR